MTCGGGIQRRLRNCDNPTPAFGGDYFIVLGLVKNFVRLMKSHAKAPLKSAKNNAHSASYKKYFVELRLCFQELSY